jgi:hypothetical protein
MLAQAQTRQLGPAHRDTLRSRLNLACLLADKGDVKEAERLCRAVVRRPWAQAPSPRARLITGVRWLRGRLTPGCGVGGGGVAAGGGADGGVRR